jgi:hypothetical protein
VDQSRPEPPRPTRWPFLIGLLEAAAAYLVVGAGLTALHQAGLRLPGPLGQQQLAVGVLLGATVSALVGRIHQDRGHEKQAAGAFAGIAVWPPVVILIVLSRFLLMVVGRSSHGV